MEFEVHGKQLHDLVLHVEWSLATPCESRVLDDAATWRAENASQWMCRV